MFTKDILFWNVDTQIDFMRSQGKLYAIGAEEIETNLKQLTNFAKENNIRVVNTADYHFADSQELSDKPDFVNTFPEHCMANTNGADFIAATKPSEYAEAHWNKTYSKNEISNIISNRNIVIRKDAFDVFEGNLNTENILQALNSNKVFVYGVTTNVCVDCAAIGLAKRNYEVYVIEDAIKELPNIPLPFEKWDKLGVKRIKITDLEKHLA
ncbi:cysteine hydrolase family protein [Marinifilum sp. RC60d5]|uniref:cysteine hydrolase family protein n=1 Tax=Marinifilum sp. RC60d5 TaxID=3458414 RepID=UPI0040356920